MHFTRMVNRIAGQTIIRPIPRCFMDAAMLDQFDRIYGRLEFFCAVRGRKPWAKDSQIIVWAEGSDGYRRWLGKREDEYWAWAASLAPARV